MGNTPKKEGTLTCLFDKDYVSYHLWKLPKPSSTLSHTPHELYSMRYIFYQGPSFAASFRGRGVEQKTFAVALTVVYTKKHELDG